MKKYPEYKITGVGEFTGIPSEWEIVKLKYLSSIRYGLGQPPKAKEDGLPIIRATNIERGKIVTKDLVYVDPDDLPYEKDPILKEGEIIVVRSGAYTADSAIIPPRYAGSVAGYDLVLRCHSVVPKFLSHVLLSSYVLDEQLLPSSSRAAQPHLNAEEVGSTLICRPSNEEQTAIANFLDHKTQLIDDLITKKERLIELLKEERAAVINQAVTKGLDLNVPMKNLGIEWLGDIPEHWDIIKLKFLSLIRYGLGQPPKLKENGLPIIRATNIHRGEITRNELLYVDPEDLPYERNPILNENEIIVVRSGAYTADSAIIPEEYAGSVTGYDLVVTCQSIDPRLISFALLSSYIFDKQLIPVSTRAAQPHLNAEELGSTIICVPPMQEQNEISEFLLFEKERMNKLINSCMREIELFAEYKTSLINEAVTGKINVIDAN